MNIRNAGIAQGRLVKDPVLFENSDGSKKVFVTLALRDNFKNAEGEYASQFIQFEGWVSAEAKGNGVYDFMKKGDMVALQYTVISNQWTDKNDVKHYEQNLRIQSVDLMEPKPKED